MGKMRQEFYHSSTTAVVESEIYLANMFCPFLSPGASIGNLSQTLELCKIRHVIYQYATTSVLEYEISRKVLVHSISQYKEC
jgi:hypothetical protein